MRVFSSLDEVAAAAHTEIGTSEWLEIEQERVNLFADATDDHQWIHVDIEKANEGPFGGPIAHGYLTLSLLPYLGSQVFAFETPGARLNYGAQQGPLPAPGPGRQPGPRARLGRRGHRPPDRQAGRARLHDRDRGPGQAGLRRRDGRAAAALRRACWSLAH